MIYTGSRPIINSLKRAFPKPSKNLRCNSAPFPQTIFHFNCLVLIIINSLFGKKSKFKYQFEFLQSIRVGCQLAANIYFPGEITEYWNEYNENTKYILLVVVVVKEDLRYKIHDKTNTLMRSVYLHIATTSTNLVTVRLQKICNDLRIHYRGVGIFLTYFQGKKGQFTWHSVAS